ncbi:MAG: efflux RND transporter permease subunit [Amphritea sp.]|nr:efflux RND transporter permease subunit [Amphritea sp.]
MITRYALQGNRVTIAMAVILCLLGIVLYQDFPSQEEPEINVREAVVSAQYPGLPPERVENLIIRQLEDAIRQIPEVKDIRSQASTGYAQINVSLHDHVSDLQPVWQTLRNKVNDAKPKLPQGTSGPHVNDDFGRVAVASIAFIAEGFTLAEMRQAVKRFQDQLTALPGVSRIEMLGNNPERIYLESTTTRLAQYGVPIEKALQVLQQRNVILPAGQIASDKQRLVLETTGNLTRIDEIANIPVRLEDNSIVYLGDLFTVTRGYQEPAGKMAYYNGKQALVLAVSMQSGYNVLSFSERLKQRVNELESTLPWGFEIDYVTFQAKEVKKSIDQVIGSLLQTVVVVLVVVVLFLGIRTGLVAGLLVPLTILVTLVVMFQLGIPLQKVSIAAIIIALGLLVDNGIVVSENYLSRVTAGESALDAAINAGSKLALPLLTASLTTILAFYPLMAGDNPTIEYTRSLGQVITITLLCSWLVALTIIPLLATWVIKPGKKATGNVAEASAMQLRYKQFLQLILHGRTLFMLAMAGLLVLALLAFGLVPKKFMPSNVRQQYMIEVELPAGYAIEETERVSRNVSHWLQNSGENPQISNHITYIGFGGPRFVLSLSPNDPAPHRAFILVNLTDEASQPDEILRAREYLSANFPEARIEVKGFGSGGAEDGTVEFRIKGPDHQRLREASEQLQSVLYKEPGVIDIRQDWDNKVFKIKVQIDQTRAELVGMSTQQISEALDALLNSGEISQFREGDQSIPITVRSDVVERGDAERLGTLYVGLDREGNPVTLAQVANLIAVPTESLQRRYNLEPTITVKAVSKQLTAVQLVEKLQPDIAALNLPAEYSIEYGGEVEASGEAQASLSANIPIAFAAIFLLLLAQFRSFRKVGIIAVTLVFSLIGASFGLLLMQATFGFMAMLGFLSLGGIIINNGILLVEQFDLEMADGKSAYEAIVDGATARLRPILVTTGTSILGLLPLMLGGDELWYGLTVVLASGLLGGTLLTLGVVPVLYSMLFRVKIR